MIKKKGLALNQAFGAVLTLILIGVLVIIGIFLFVNLGASFTDLADVSSVDETVDMSAGGPKTLSNGLLCNPGGFAISSVLNDSTSGVDINSGNYSISSEGILTNLTSEFTTTNWIVNSTSNYGGAACDATDTMVVQFGTYPVLIGLVGTVIFLGLVIGVLVASFAFGGREV